MDTRNIYQRINAVMVECDYIKKEAAQMGTGVKYDVVIAMLRSLLIKHGIVVVMRQKSLDQVGGLEGKNQKIYQGSYEMDLVNMDDPTQLVTHSAFAHGMDGGDKAPGKAHTYAAKLMLVKGFGIETGDDEESRSEKLEKLNTINEDQQSKLASLIDGDNGIWNKLCAAYKITHLNQIQVSKYADVLKRTEAAKNGNN